MIAAALAPYRPMPGFTYGEPPAPYSEPPRPAPIERYIPLPEVDPLVESPIEFPDIPMPWWVRLKRWWAFRAARAEARKAARMAKRDAAIARRRELATSREIARMEQLQARRLKRELLHARRAISERLTRLEFAHWRINQKRQQISRLRFAQVAATPAALFMRVDTVRMPRGRGITTDALSDPQILHELALACGSPVSTYRHYANGFWIVVERAGGLGAIPDYVEFDEVYRQMPDSAAPLDIPLGIGVNKRFHHVNIAEMPHLLVAGATGFGKSVFLHNLICTVIQRASPHRVKLLMVDLKGGTGLGGYAGLPHLWSEQRDGIGAVEEEEEPDPSPEVTTGRRRKRAAFAVQPVIYSRREDVVPVLQRVFYECERRFQAFNRAGVRDCTGYNRKNPHNPMPYLLVVVDEIQNVMLDKKERGDAERLLTDIASRSRAAGVHLVIATQRPSVDVITGLIKANFPARIAFAVSSGVDSRVILDNGEAAEIGRKGMLIYQQEMKQIKCQSAFVSEGYAADVVERVKAGAPAKSYTAVGKLDILRWVIEQNGGHFDMDAIHKEFSPRGVKYQDVKTALRELAVADVELDGNLYRWKQRDSQFLRVLDDGRLGGSLSFETVARWALEHNHGKLNKRDAFKQFKNSISYDELLPLLASRDGQTVIIDGDTFTIEPGKGSHPRTLQRVTEDVTTG